MEQQDNAFVIQHQGFSYLTQQLNNVHANLCMSLTLPHRLVNAGKARTLFKIKQLTLAHAHLHSSTTVQLLLAHACSRE